MQPVPTDRQSLERVSRLYDALRQSDRDLLAHRVCVLRPVIGSCAVAARLAGARVKVKCRSSSTHFKSKPVHVPAGGGKFGFAEPTGVVVYEGDDALRFELCQASRLRPSRVMAVGILSLDAVFATIGLEGDAGSWTVQLLFEDAQVLGSLEVVIRCQVGALWHHGGLAALRALAPLKRPEPSTDPLQSLLQPPGPLVEKYCLSCSKAGEGLQAAVAKATALAGPAVADVALQPAALANPGAGNAGRLAPMPEA